MVSIVVPVYNAEKYLEHCIDSVLQQTYQDWELLLVENGSQDMSLSICRKYARKDERIRVFDLPRNQGVSAARNWGMEKAEGEFFSFLDADDRIKEDYLEQLTRLQKEYQAEMVLCGYEKVYEISQEKYPQQKKQEEESRVRVFDTVPYMEQYLLNGNTHCWGALYSRKLLSEIAFPTEFTIGEDLLFLIEAAENSGKIVVTDYKGYFYYINRMGAMKKKFTLSYMDQIFCWERAYEKILAISPELKDKTESILLVSAMLTAGKLAQLKKEELKKYEEQIKICLKTVRKYAKNRKTHPHLPKGYLLKVKMFAHLPSVYLRLYGWIGGKVESRQSA